MNLLSFCFFKSSATGAGVTIDSGGAGNTFAEQRTSHIDSKE
jgi:hypothetical protein